VAIFFETITNPFLEIVDIAKLSEVAEKHRVLLVADSTSTPPNVLKASAFGVHMEVISSTKMISGGATSVGGLIVDYGTFDWQHNKKLEELAGKFGPWAFNYLIRREVHRNLGACLSPYHAYLQSLGLETLQLRFEKAAGNCQALAEYLQSDPRIKQVNYAGLKSSDNYEIGRKQFGMTPGALLTFNLRSREECFTFLNKLKIINRATNIYDNRTLIIHPASTMYGTFSPETRDILGVSDTMLRLSVGIEDVKDLIQDIDLAFA
jgi:O-acetylhomoserine (thiol)-lyase